MGGNLQLEVVTPTGKVFSADVTELQFPTAFRGYYGILPDHTPVLTPLGDGLISCFSEGKKTVLTVFGGFAEVGPGHVRILARESETSDMLNRDTIINQMNEAERSLLDTKDQEEQQKIQTMITACKLRLSALG